MIAKIALSPLEAAITGLWTSVLGAARIAPSDDFFTLGGDESKLTALLGHVNLLFGVRLQAKDLRDGITVAELTRLIEHARNGAAAKATTTSGHAKADANPLDRQSIYPLSATQRRMWFLAKLDPDSSAYVQWRATPHSRRLRASQGIGAHRVRCESET